MMILTIIAIGILIFIVMSQEIKTLKKKIEDYEEYIKKLLKEENYRDE